MKYNRLSSNVIFLLFIFTELPTYLEGFLMTRVDPGRVVAQPGQTVSLKCKVDDHWEWCKFISPKGTVCEFEWKLFSQNVTLQKSDCTSQMEFFGQYDDYECGITFTSISKEDSGTWTCDIEEYITFGSRGSGRTVKAQIEVLVTEPTPPPTAETTPPPASAATTIPTTSSSGTTTVKPNNVSSTVSEPKLVEDSESSSVSSVPDPVPQVDKEETSGTSSISVVVGIVCAVVILSLVALAVYMRNRYRRSDRAAAVVYRQEANSINDRQNIIPGGRPGAGSVVQLDGGSRTSYNSADNSNYHEFFPPSFPSGQNPNESNA